ncbi:MAG: DnaA regulatory inactivator Hda [Lysobacteraceae bacterium]|nr:MAG: DnaA regulatory inactivator Hda [Xanthomonadaceae bacterium]
MSQQDRLGPQLPLALRYPPDQRFETWLGAPAALARLQALAAGDGAAPFLDSLFLQGANGSGKSHLLLAACAAAEAAGRRANYLSLARVRGHARDALQGIEHADLVALDDLDALAGQRDDEIALFDLHNRVRDAGVGLVYAARDVPAALPLVLPDLRSRLAQCTLLALHALDDDGRADVLRQRATSRGLVFDDAALDWLLKRCSRDLSDLSALFERLDRASLAAQRRLTVPFLRQVLGA